MAPPWYEVDIVTSVPVDPLADLGAATREALRAHDALERGRGDDLRRLQAAVATAERAFDQAEPDQVHLRRRLGERLETALREVNDRKAFFQLVAMVAGIGVMQAMLLLE